MAGSCCWQPNTQLGPRTNPGPGEPVAGMTGVIPLAAYPDCLEPYQGDHRNELAYLVGWATQHERVFRSDQSGMAISHAASITPPLAIDRILMSSLCTAAVVDLYA